MRLQGVFTALVTPFNKDGSVDETALRELVEGQIKAGISGLVPMGTTGESPTLDHKEHMRVIEVVVDQTKRRVPVIAGTGSNSTDEAVMMTKQAHAIGPSQPSGRPLLQQAEPRGLLPPLLCPWDCAPFPASSTIYPALRKNVETQTICALPSIRISWASRSVEAPAGDGYYRGKA
jgi:4-hydroxy-tetrahydrodipicolinate synthase